MAVCLQCGTRFVAGSTKCDVCGLPRIGSLPPPPRQKRVLFGGPSILVAYAVAAVSQIPVMLILYLVPGSDTGRPHCADTFFASACGLAGAAIETVVWVIPFLFALAVGIVFAQRLTEPSLIGPGVVVFGGVFFPWLYAVAHITGAFPTV